MEFNLHSLQGNAIIIFLSVSCTSCVDLMPQLLEMKKNISDSFVVFCTAKNDVIEEMIEYFQWEFPVIHLSASLMDQYFSINKLPSFVFINEKHYITNKEV